MTRSQFRGFANEIIQLANSNAKNTFAVVQSLATATTSYALASDEETFPFVTLPHFARRAEESVELSGAEVISWAPIVQKEQLALWNAYSEVEVAGWLGQGVDVLPIHTSAIGSLENPPGEPFFAPIWELFPAPEAAAIVNEDLMSIDWMRALLQETIITGHVLLSQVEKVDFLFDSLASQGDLGEEKPRSYIVEPVFQTFDDQTTVAGFIIAVLPWEPYFTNVLTRGTNGILVNIKDTCGSDFSYRINGPTAEFAGVGDIHESKYDNLGVQAEFAEEARFDGDVEGFDACDYTITVYPSTPFEESYYSSDPIIYTCAIVMVFVFVAMVFVVYDFLVTRRQNKVSALARRTNAIVSSLFPKNIQRRIMEEAEQAAANEVNLNKKRFRMGAKSELNAFLGGNSDEQQQQAKSKPIADLFPVRWRRDPLVVLVLSK